jgi:hypothetical protein
MAPLKKDVREGKGKLEESDREKECLISEECKRELDSIREDIKKGNYIKVKNVKGLAKRCGLEK